MIQNNAYGRVIPSENIELTHVEQGSPMGEVFRRFWQPVALSSELTDLPKAVKILCEELVLFRDGTGKVGCLEPHCAHRGATLEFGRVEQRGIRCCYHGWLYATDGKCIEMPCEESGACERRQIYQPAYPTMEYGGLVFIYMGPAGTEPLFPMYDLIDTRGRDDVELRGMQIWDGYGVGYVRNCNWLQHYENAVDPYHLLILHQMISGDQFKSGAMHGKPPQISFLQTEHGVAYKFVRDLDNGHRYVRYLENIVPNIFLIPNLHESGEIPKHHDRCTDCSWVIPIDNEHLTAFSIVAWPLRNGKPRTDWRPGSDTKSDIRPGSSNLPRPYEQRQRFPDDLEAQEGQRPIAIHALENLGRSDRGIVMLRHLLHEQVKTVQSGHDPQNVVRNEKLNHALQTRAWNTILSREEAENYDAQLTATA